MVLNLGKEQLRILHSPPVPLKGTNSDVNNNSLVLHFTYGDVAFLFTGDLDREGQEYILRQRKEIAAEILKFPHHGSRLAYVPQFMAQVNPAVTGISVGANPFGQPAPLVLTALAEGGVPIYRTDTQGAITITTDGRTFRVQTFLGAWWRRNWYD